MARYELLPEEKLRIAQAALDTKLRALYQTELEAIANDEDGQPGAGGNARVRVSMFSEQANALREKLKEAEKAVDERAKKLGLDTEQYLKRDRHGEHGDRQ